MQYTETELSDLIKSVEAEFSAHLALAKSEDFPPKKEEESTDEPADEGTEDSQDEPQEESQDEGQDEASDDQGEESQEESQDEGQEDAPQDDQQMSDGHDYDEDDMNQMQAMYSSMSRGELKAHHDCIKMCLDAQKGEEEMSAPAPAEQEQADPAPEMQKSEETVAIEIPEVKNEEVALLKSEVEAEKAKSEDLKKSLDMVTELLTKMVQKSAPKAKAVTELQVINKSEVTNEVKPLSKSEITAKLNAVASRPDLAKSDREAINAFYLTNNPNIESISHLLK